MTGLLLICLVAVVAGGIGYMLGRRAAERQHAMFPAGQVPLQQRDGPQEYYQPYNNDGPGYRPQQQGYQAQQQGYAQQQQGINPWVAGGIGAAAGGVLGYGLGQAMAENETHEADAAPAEDNFADIGSDFGGEW
jgi:membrane protein YqaA with SNARE-associated domain